ncbi:MAG TPA: formyltransferase family protein [Ktedonobacteraceae bacterium]|nr:formyltransferase family protein [Ktedonobacteraceae bacterium]
MSNSFERHRAPRVVFFGMQGSFSPPSLHALLAGGIDVRAVVLPASAHHAGETPAIFRHEQFHPARPLLPVVHSSLHVNVLRLASEWQLPVWEVNNLSAAETLETLAVYEPDVICVACFPLRIPRSVLSLPRLGCLNVHPSLLPANRGPVPLFWTFREGAEHTGVTIHFMEETLDSGDILAQEVIPVRDGMTHAQLEAQCATRGGKLLADCVHDLMQGRAQRVPQDERRSSYHPYPSEEDFVIPATEWSARHVYNFIYGVAEWGEPLTLLAGGERLPVKRAISYSHELAHEVINSAQDGQEEVYFQVEDVLWVRCNEGWVAIG